MRARLTLTTPRLATAIFFVGLAAMATRVALDTDLWWHLAAGRWMVEHGRLLTEDVFTHAFLGSPYIYRAWITDVALYLTFAAFGHPGLSLFVSAFVVLAFFFVHRSCSGGPYLRAFCLVLAATASAVYWAPRPHIVSFALVAAFGYVLHLWRWRGVDRLWVLPVLMLLWVNVHPGFALGFILLVLTLLGQIVSALSESLLRARRRPGSVGWGGALRLAMMGLACALAASVNPAGPRFLLYPFDTVSISVLRDFINEWQSPNFHLVYQQVFIWLLLAVFGAVGLARRRLDPTDFVLVSGTAYLALLAGRNIALFAVVAAPVLTRHVEAGVQELRARFPRLPAPGESATRPRAVALNWALLGLVSLAAVLKMLLPMQPSLVEAERARFLPLRAAEYLARARPAGPMFNSYNWGGFLQWELYGQYLVSVDGRTDLYPNQYLLDYLNVVYGQPGWREILERDRIRLVVMESGAILTQFLRTEPGWDLVYEDEVAAVFKRTGGSG